MQKGQLTFALHRSYHVPAQNENRTANSATLSRVWPHDRCIRETLHFHATAHVTREPAADFATRHLIRAKQQFDAVFLIHQLSHLAATATSPDRKSTRLNSSHVA